MDLGQPIPAACHRPRVQPRQGRRQQPLAQARPQPIFRWRHQVGTQGVSLHGTQHREQGVVLLARESLVTPLPDVPDAAVALAVMAHLGRQQPLPPAGHVLVAARPPDTLEVIGPQARAEHPHGHAGARRTQQAHKAVLVVLARKDLGALVAPVGDVITVAADSGAGRSWHATSVPFRPAGCKHPPRGSQQGSLGGRRTGGAKINGDVPNPAILAAAWFDTSLKRQRRSLLRWRFRLVSILPAASINGDVPNPAILCGWPG